MSEAPFSSRPFGFCSQGLHERCLGFLRAEGAKPYRCPCDCHEVASLPPEETSWQLALPMTKPLSLNDRDHWRVKAKKVAQVKDDTITLVKGARIPAMKKVRVTLVYEPRDARRRDPLNLVATLKAVQDGIVEAGVVPDDTVMFMESPMPLIDAPIGGKHGKMWVLIEKIA